MNNKFSKKVLSVVLCIALIMTYLPLSIIASAAEAAADITVTIDTGASVTLKDTDGDGYYEIDTADELHAFAAAVNGGNYSVNAKLTADISLGGQSRPWVPIALSKLDREAYSGTFDGQGHTISNLYFNDTTAFNAGLFGYVKGGTVRNVIVADGYVAAIWGGAIAGRFSGNGTLAGCGNQNTTVTFCNAGGIVGTANGAVIACWNTGNISGDTWVGGICAYLQGSMNGCWNTGEISGDRCGGIVGSTAGAKTVTYCYNDGMVKGDSDYEGSIIGSQNGGGRPKMSNCYYTFPLGGAYSAYGEESNYYFTNVGKVNASMLPTGECALFLNQGLAGTGYQYYQNLDNGKTVDAYPVTDSSHGTVYKGYKICSSSISYSNSPLSSTIYHPGIGYNTDGLTIREVCTSNCTVSQGFGSVTLVVGDTYYTGNAQGATVTGSLQGGATYKVTYNGSETVPYKVGHYTAKLTVYEDGTEMGFVSADYDIRYLPSPGIDRIGGSYYQNNGVYWFADGAVAEVIAPDGYGISRTLNEDYTGSVSLSESDAKTVYLKQVSDGSMTGSIDLSSLLKWDNEAPEGRVEISTGNFWTQLVKKITFGMFFKETETVTITAQDSDSGVKSIQYYYFYDDLINDSSLSNADVVAKLEAAIGNGWKDYSEPIELEFDGKYIVYAKITDNVGNVTYVSSDGLVLYSDATTTTTSLTTTYKAGEGSDISLVLNGNTVNEVKCGNVVLAETDYTVSGDKITLKSEYLDTLVVGNYTITVSFNPQGVPYKDSYVNDKPAELMVNLTMNPKEVTVPTADTTSFVYNGSEHTYAIAASNDYTVTGNKQIGAGTHTVTVFLKDKDNTVWADGTKEDKTYTFYISKADRVAPTGIGKEDETISKKEDGKITGVDSAMEYRAESESTYTAITGSEIENLAAGKYYVRVKSDSNHNASPDTAVTIATGRKLKINVPQNQVGYTLTSDVYEFDYLGNAKLSFSLKEGYSKQEGFKISLNGNPDAQWLNGELPLSGIYTDVNIVVEGVADITSPDVEINVKENKWTSFLNGLTFGLFFKETQDVTIIATDKGSGVKSVQYYLSEVEQGLDELSAITDWQEYNGTFKIDEERRYIIYARVTDNSGNIMCINSDGIILDKTAPIIYRIEEGGKYYGMNVFTFNDEHSGIASLKIDGVETAYAPAEPSIYITPDNAEHTVTVTDMAGNVTEYHITVYKNYTVTFKADDATVDTQIVGYGKDATLPAIPAKEGFVGKWDAEGKNITEDTTINAVYTEIPVVKPDEVKPEDKSDLEDAKAKLEEMLEDDSYTDNDKKDIQDAIDDVDDALMVIENIEAFYALIEKLPENITKSDKKAIKAAEEAYNALTDYEKSLVDKDAQKTLENAKDTLLKLNKPTNTDKTSSDVKSPQTADNRNLWLLFALMFISGGGILGTTLYGKKIKEEEN